MEKVVIGSRETISSIFKRGLESVFFSLPYEMHIVDLVLHEIENTPYSKYMERLVEDEEVAILQTSSEELNEVLKLLRRNISIADSASIFLAEKHSAILLSEDNVTRDIAEKNGICTASITSIMDRHIDRENICEDYKAAWVEDIKRRHTINIKLEINKI